MASHHQGDDRRPVGLSIGYFSPRNELGDVEAVSERIREICGPANQAFPFVRKPLKNADGTVGLFYCVVAGPVPIHVERPKAAESCSAMFTFVIDADERPVLLFAPAGQREAACIFQPEDSNVPTMGLGAAEMWPGRVFHFDIARAFAGVTSFPTGDPMIVLPQAVLIQLPWTNARDIGGAILAMKRLIAADPQFADLVQGGDRHAVG
jgi:hypothetical protein